MDTAPPEPDNNRSTAPALYICGTLATTMTAVTVIYWLLVAAADAPEPPLGLFPLLAMLIAVLSAVPISLWAARCAARPNTAEIAALRAEVREALDRGFEAAEREGRWEGIVSELRSNPSSANATADVVGLARRRGN